MLTDPEKAAVITALHRWPLRRGNWAFDDGLWHNDKQTAMAHGCPAVVLQLIRGHRKPTLLDELDELATECGLNDRFEFTRILDREPKRLIHILTGKHV